MSAEKAEFFDALGGDASTGFDTEGREVGMSFLPYPDGSVGVTLALDLEPGRMGAVNVRVSKGQALEWALLLQTVAAGA